MTQEEKVRQIANAPIEDLGENVDSFFYKLCKKAYNLGVQEAADNAEVIWIDSPKLGDKNHQTAIVNLESITKLKIK